MATWNKAYGFVEHLAEGVHNLGSDQLTVVLSNTAPSAEATDPTVSTADCVKANITEIGYGDCSTRDISLVTSSQAGGTYKLILGDLTLTSSGTVGPFRYIYIVNDTPTSPADPVLGYYDNGSSVTLANTETFVVDFDATNGLIKLM